MAGLEKKEGNMGRRGFTLVEVLIVVIIIGILAAIGIPQFASSIEKAKGGEARAGLGHVQTAEKIYYAENEVYTSTLGNLDITLTQRYWAFTISTPSAATYTATATRSGGARNGQTITMNQAGTISGNWEFI
ncbi:MAG: type IV pilin protein [Candidatus Omnitrophota bacterium]